MEFLIPKTQSKPMMNASSPQCENTTDSLLRTTMPHLSVYCRDTSGEVVGGLTGQTYWNYLDIGFLFVEEMFGQIGEYCGKYERCYLRKALLRSAVVDHNPGPVRQSIWLPISFGN